MNIEKFIEELEEIASNFEQDGMYALKGLKDKIEKLKNVYKDDD